MGTGLIVDNGLISCRSNLLLLLCHGISTWRRITSSGLLWSVSLTSQESDECQESLENARDTSACLKWSSLFSAFYLHCCSFEKSLLQLSKKCNARSRAQVCSYLLVGLGFSLVCFYPFIKIALDHSSNPTYDCLSGVLLKCVFYALYN